MKFCRDDAQFCLMTSALAALLWAGDVGASYLFTQWAEKFNTPAKIEHVVVTEKIQPAKPELSDTDRMKRCKRDRECSKMAEALVYEARGESLQGAVAVGYVIVERTKNPDRWGDTIREVVNDGCQFSYRCWKQKRKPKAEDWERAYVASYQILHQEIGNPIGASDHYHTKKVKPKWAKSMTYVATIGNHKFYRSNLDQ